ncbi:MAG: 30S ribosomal protein S17 [Candidatus Cloacimonetes bacterium]|nr:30S ribosomal protein S17 [Candidatus Cloacimonadota bacterium]
MAIERKVVKSGVVISDKMDKTIVVKVQRQFKHPLYKKIVRRNKNFKAHDEQNECKLGDYVEIKECRPLSREKRWTLNKIIERSK